MTACQRSVGDAERTGPAWDAGVAFAESPAFKPVARGLKGLRFGMTQAEVETVLPELSADTEFNMAAMDLHLLLAGDTGGDLPGPVRVCSTTLGPQPATCALSFVVDERLSAMACELEPSMSAEMHRSVEQAILETLVRSYGKPTTSPDPAAKKDFIETEKKTWIWQDAGARLEIRSELNTFVLFTSKIQVLNQCSEFLALVSHIEREREQKEQQERQREELLREQQMQHLKDESRSFEKDL